MTLCACLDVVVSSSNAGEGTHALWQNHVWGTSGQCIEKLRGIAEKSIGLFAREVLPAVHELKLEAPIDDATATR